MKIKVKEQCENRDSIVVQNDDEHGDRYLL